MALFRSLSKACQVKAVVSDLQCLKEICFNTKLRAGPVFRRFDSSQSTLQSVAPVTSIATHQRGLPDSHLLPHGFQRHPLITDDVLVLPSNSWGCNPGSRRGFWTDSHLGSSAPTPSSKAGSSGESKTEQDSAALERDRDSAPETHAASKVADESMEAGKDDGEQDEDDDNEPLVAKYDEMGKPLSNWTRMKMMMKAYGYVIIPVHWIIAPVWFGTFYYAVKMGVDIAPFLLKVGVSEHHVSTLKNSGASNALMAYTLYKIFTPLRYTLTLGATEMTIRYLRRKGYIKHAPRKEKTYRQSFKETVRGVKDKIDNR